MNSPSPTRGYYSILQYVPDLERNEGANVGVVLFCRERKFLKAQTATGNDRVRRFFSPDEDLDLDRINAYKAAFEERVALESEGSWTLDEFREFVNTRANLLLLTEPRPIKVTDPQAELAKLFESLVGGRKRRTGRSEAATRERELNDRFDVLLAERGLVQRVERNVQIVSALLDRTLMFPFAYRNGHLNVIQSVAFEGSKNNKIDRACQLAVEGQDLADRPAFLRRICPGPAFTGQNAPTGSSRHHPRSRPPPFFHGHVLVLLKPSVYVFFPKPPLISNFRSWNLRRMGEPVDGVLAQPKVGSYFFERHQEFHGLFTPRGLRAQALHTIAKRCESVKVISIYICTESTALTARYRGFWDESGALPE